MKAKKCILLLPTAYNDGKDVPPSVLSGIFRELDTEFDGYSQGGLVRGTYTMDDGTLVRDKSLMVWFILPNDEKHVALVRRKAAKFAKILRQESLYMEVLDVDAEFVRPSAAAEEGENA